MSEFVSVERSVFKRVCTTLEYHNNILGDFTCCIF